MSKKLDFSIAVKLAAENFNKGIKNIQGQLNNFKKMAINAFGAFSALQFGKDMIRAGSDFQDAMARVQAISKASTNDLKALREEAMRLGKDTKFTATEAATALEQLIRNGLKPMAAKQALGGVLQLAQSQAISLAEAADIATTSMNAFGLSTKDLTRINDVLAATASNTATNVLELFEAFKIAAPIAKSAGVSLEETATVLGSLANQGFRGSEAGTGLKQIILAIADKTPDAIKVAEKYGIQLDEVSLRSEGLIKTLERMKKAAMGFSIQDLSQFANKLGAPKMAAVLGSDMSELYQAVANSQGEAARMFNEGLGEFEKAQKTLISVYENTQIKVFDSFKNLFTEPLNILAEFIRRIQDVPTVMVGAVGLALSKIGSIFQKTQTKLKSFAEQEYTKELNKRGDAYQNAAIAQSITNINNGVSKDTANYYKSLHNELGQVATQFDLSTKNGKVYQKLMNDLSYITNASTTNTQKYKRAIANVADTLSTFNRQSQNVNVNVLRTAYTDFERDKSKIVASASNFQSTMTTVFSKIGNAAKTVGRSVLGFFGGWVGLALSLATILGTTLYSAWRKTTEAVRTANKLMDESKQKNVQLETTFLQLINVLRTHERTTYEWQAAMAKLKREYPELLEKLHLEQVSVNQSAEEYNKLAGRIRDVIKWQKQYNTFTAKQNAIEELTKNFFQKNSDYQNWMKNLKKQFQAQFGDVSEVAEIKKTGMDVAAQNILMSDLSDSIKKEELVKLYTETFKDAKYKASLKSNAEYFGNGILGIFNKNAGKTISELNKNFNVSEPIKDKLTNDIDKYLSDKEGELNLGIAAIRKEGTAKGWNDEEIKQKINVLAKDLIDEIYKELDGQSYTDKKGDKRSSLEYAQTTGSYQFIKNQSIANIAKPDKKAEQRENSIADAEKRYAINLDYYSRELELNLIDDKKFHEKKLSALQSLISSYEFNGDASKLETAKYKDLIKIREELIKTLKKENDDEERAKELNRYNREASSRAAYLKKNYNNVMSGAGREKINKWDFLSFDAKEDKSSQVTLNYLKAQLDKLKQVRSNITEDDIAKAKELKTEGSNELLNQVKLLDNAIQMLGEHVTNLEDKFQLKQAQEAIKELDKEVRRGTYEGIKQTVSVSNQLIDTIKGFENFDEMSGWEQFQYIVDSIFTTIDAMLELTEMWERLDKLMDNFATATQSLSSIETNAAQQRIAATQAEANAVVSAEATKAAAKTQSSAQSIAADTAEAAVEKTTATANVAANTAEAASSAGKSAAKLPFPFNLLAIGGAIAGVLALFSAIPKFASGGVVGGSKFNGDQNLARVNAGEAILTKNQQSRLFRMLNGGSSSINNGNVEFKIKGSELIGVLKNYNGKMNKV